MTPRTEAGTNLALLADGDDQSQSREILTGMIVKIEDEAFEAGRLAGRAEAEGKEQTS